MEKVKCYIFSWKGQYNNALRLENQLKGLVDVTVINSDDDNKPEHWINIGNECYFSEQFQVALVDFDSDEYDVFLHIQADASFDDFESIINSAKTSFEKYNWGVYAPNVDDTFYIPQRTDVFDLDDGLKVVATTDNTCWFIHKDMIEELKENLYLMEGNELGWGWDLLICTFAHLNNRKVIRDYNYTVNHPPSTGYKKEQAENEMFEMYQKCPDKIKECVYYIKTNPLLINKYYNNSVPDVFIYDTGV